MTSIMVLKFFGIYFSVMGLAILLHPKRMWAVIEEIVASKALTFIAGFLPLIIGALLVVVHPFSISGFDVPTVMTILSCLILVGGMFRLLCPDYWIRTVKTIHVKMTAPMGAVIAVVGALLIYVGYLT